jgi:hypothetical protein
MAGGAPSSPAELERLEDRIDSWLAEQLTGNPAVAAVERDVESGERRWFVRLHGEQKDVFSVWFHLQQRNLHVETYLMPAPEENAGELYEHLLRRNQRLDPFSFSIGEEDGIFLVTSIGNGTVDEAELDRLLGSAYEYTELCFRPAMRIGFASRFKA